LDFFTKMLEFSGKVVAVTGGLGLIGKQVSLAFNEFDATLVVLDIHPDLFDKYFASYPNIHFLKMNITEPDEIKAGVEKIIKDFQKIDVWVNTAYPKTKDWGKFIDDVSFESWNKNISMHLGGYFWSSKLVLDEMKTRKSGSLINFGSMYGAIGPNFNVYAGTDMTTPVAYSAIKGALASLTRYLATLYGAYNIRVNCIAPGGVHNNQNENFVKRYNELTPLRRMGKAYEIAMPTVFLASEAASYITGQILMVDGGWTAQ
jgi:NAD(P)-dependent dehydrogenase (short-subunit alcohol dehydrogenase family)